MNNLFIRSYSININGHIHNDYHQLLMPVFGYIDLYIEEKKMHVHHGEAVFIPKGIFHQFSASENFQFLVMNTEQKLEGVTESSQLKVLTLNQNILNYLTFVHKQLTSNHDLKVEKYIFNLLQQLLVNIINNQPEKIDDRIKKVVHQINEDISKKYTTKTLAEMACLSPSHFKTLFKQQLSCTPLEYITNLRMEKAIGLLRHTDLPISLIVEKCGYYSSASFNKRFYEYYHQTPLKFRKSKN